MYRAPRIFGAVSEFIVIIRQLEHHPLGLRVFYFIRTRRNPAALFAATVKEFKGDPE